MLEKARILRPMYCWFVCGCEAANNRVGRKSDGPSWHPSLASDGPCPEHDARLSGAELLRHAARLSREAAGTGGRLPAPAAGDDTDRATVL